MGKLKVGENDLLTWCQNNGEWGQQLIDEWVGLDEYNNPIKMSEISRASPKKVQWKCKDGHVWITKPNTRTSQKCGCPICSTKKIGNSVSKARFSPGINDLKTWCENNGARGKQLLDEWVGQDDNGNNIDISRIAFGSHKVVMWKCLTCGHTWKRSINQRTSGAGCPACHNLVVTEDNSLLTWCSNNGSIGKLVSQEWTGLSETGEHFELSEVTKATNRNMLWRCSDGHEWWVSINSRTAYKTRCPLCNTASTSYPEQFIYLSLAQVYPDVINRYIRDGMEIDIYIPSLNLGIEYNGDYWHRYKDICDTSKADRIRELGIRLIIVYDDSKCRFDEKFDVDYISCNVSNAKNRDYVLIKIVSYILDGLGVSSDIDFDNIKNLAFEASSGVVGYEDRLPQKYPELFKEFNQQLNSEINLGKTKCQSHIKVKWTCINCGHGKNGEWVATLNRRCARGYETGCPKCGYNWYKAQTGQPQKLKKSSKAVSTWDNNL